MRSINDIESAAVADTGLPAHRTVGSMTVEGFFDRLASADPTPGGGAAAALFGAAAASLVSMVAELSKSRPKLEPYAATVRRSATFGHRLGAELLRLADQDAAAFGAFIAVWKASKAMEPAERREAMSAAARASVEAPRSILGFCLVIAEAGERLAGRSNPNLASDLICASRAVETAAHCAADNVFINLPNLSDRAEAEDLCAEAKRMVAEVERLARATRRFVAKGVMRKPERRRDDTTDVDARSDAA